MSGFIELEYRTDVLAVGLPVACQGCKFWAYSPRRARKHGRKRVARWRCGDEQAERYLYVRRKYDTCKLGETKQPGRVNE